MLFTLAFFSPFIARLLFFILTHPERWLWAGRWERRTPTAKIVYSAEDAQAYNDAIGGEYLQVIDYRYNIRGWLKTINAPSDPLSDDLFNLELRYNTPTANGGSAQFNGNISEAIWKSAGLDKQSYGYDYDPMNRRQGL